MAPLGTLDIICLQELFEIAAASLFHTFYSVDAEMKPFVDALIALWDDPLPS